MSSWKKITHSPIAQLGAVARIVVAAASAAGQEVLGEASVVVEWFSR